VLVACAWLDYLLPPLLALDEVRSSRPYDAQLRSLLAGRWDIPLSETGAEAIATRGGYAVYFGPWPAVLRMAAADAVLRFPGKAGFVSLFLAAALGFWAAVRVTEELTGAAVGPFEVAALAGPVIAIASRASVYHEAIAWGGAFALLAALGALRYLRAPSVPRLLAVAACGAAAAASRATWLLAAGTLLLALALSALVRAGQDAGSGLRPRASRLKAWLGWPDVDRPHAHALLAVTAVAVTGLALCTVGYAKFGRWSLAPPFDLHLVYREPARLARIGGGAFHAWNLPTHAYGYLSPGTVAYSESFPWVRPTNALRFFPGTFTDDVEHFLGLPHLMGASMVLAGLGLASVRGASRERRALPIAAALAAGAAPLFVFVALCGRYLYDFYPALTVGAAVGLAALRHRPRPGLRTAVRVLAAYNLAVGIMLAFAIQRDLGQPERRAQMAAAAARIDGLVHPR
jgi:hypothetical protein